MRRQFFLGCCLVSATTVFTACGGQTNESGGTTHSPPDSVPTAPAPTENPAPPPAPILWQACPIFTGEQGTGAQCATIEVPLDWNDESGKKAELFVKRLLGSGTHK